MNVYHVGLGMFRVNKARAVMSSASSAVTYTSVYTDSQPDRVFWGANDEEVSEGDVPRVIIYRYDGLPIQPVPQDEDEREPRFIQVPNPDFMPEPVYPEYLPLEDKHMLLAKEQPLPPADSPTTELPGYVTKSDLEEDPEEYEDDETEDGLVDYPMDGGDDGDDDDGDSSRDDSDDEDKDEEEEEHLAPTDSATVVPTARITVRLQASISLPPETEVERLLAMITPSPSPPISLSPPSVGECLARVASTQTLIEAVTATLPSPLLQPLLPSLHIPPLVDHRDDILKSEQPPHKRICLSTPGSRYEIGESSTARPTRGRGTDYGFVSTVDAEERRQGDRDVGYGIRDTWVDLAEAVPELAPVTVGEVSTRVVELDEVHERDIQDVYALLEDAQDGRSRISRRVDRDSQWVDLLMGDRMTLQETVWMVEEEAYASREAWAHSIGLSSSNTTPASEYPHPDIAPGTDDGDSLSTERYKTRLGDMQDELLVHREQQRRARQPGPEARIPDHQDASGDADNSCFIQIMAPITRRGQNTPTDNTNPNNMTPESVQAMIDQALQRNPTNGEGNHRTEGVVSLTRWIEKMEAVFNISGCAIENQVKFTTCTLLDNALTCWNGQIRTLGLEAYTMTWEGLKKKMTGKYCPQGEIQKLEIELWNLKFYTNETEKINKYIRGLPDNIYGNVKSSKPKTLDETIELANDLVDQKLRTYAERSDNKRKAEDSTRNNHGHQQQPFKKQNVAKVYNMGTSEKKTYGGNLPKSSGNTNIANTQRGNGATPNGNACWVYAFGNAEKRGNTPRGPDSNVVTGTFLINNHYASILFDTGADRSFISTAFSSRIDIAPTPLDNNYPFNIDLLPVELGSFDVIIGMDWLRRCHAVIICDEKLVQIPYGNETLTFHDNESSDGKESRLTIISCSKAQEYMAKGCQVFLAQISAKKEEDKPEGKQIKDVPIVRDFLEVLPEDLPGLPLTRPLEFQIDLIPGAAPVARAPYRLAPSKMKELSEQLQELTYKG
ncbi:putative reverse transcriptase domain-containing protein, partial [Tanacetum coccineum]